MYGGNARGDIGRSNEAAQTNHARRPGKCCLPALDIAFCSSSKGSGLALVGSTMPWSSVSFDRAEKAHTRSQSVPKVSLATWKVILRFQGEFPALDLRTVNAKESG
jgi:hypothetical protein